VLAPVTYAQDKPLYTIVTVTVVGPVGWPALYVSQLVMIVAEPVAVQIGGAMAMVRALQSI